MDGFKSLPTTPAMQKLCTEQLDRQALRQTGPSRELKQSDTDKRILEQFRTDHGLKIIEDTAREGKKISNICHYGPRELNGGYIETPEHTITALIPFAPGVSATDIQVLYQSNRHKDEEMEPVSWHVRAIPEIHGNGRIVVNKGPIYFNMVQYILEPSGRDEAN